MAPEIGAKGKEDESSSQRQEDMHQVQDYQA
jgi:hypothetical protein